MWPRLSQEVILEITQVPHKVGDTAAITGVLLTRPEALGSECRAALNRQERRPGCDLQQVPITAARLSTEHVPTWE